VDKGKKNTTRRSSGIRHEGDVMQANLHDQEQSATSPSHTDKHAPGPRYLTPFSMLSEFRRDRLKFYLDLAKFGDVVRVRVGLTCYHFIAHPEYIKYVLQDNYQNYGRSSLMLMLKSALGEGLLTSDGDFWRRQRRLAQPAFHRQRIGHFATIMTECAQAMLERWEVTAKQERPVEVLAEMSRLTNLITARALFSTDVGEDVAAMSEAQAGFLEYFNYRFEHFLAWPERVPTPRNLRFRRAMQTLDRVAYDIIAQRRKDPHDRGDLLSMLMFARDEDTDESMSDRQVRDEVVTFMGAGSETTAVLLAWVWYLLSRHPEVDRKLRAELSTVLAGRVPIASDVPQLPYSRMVIEETLRLYPPAWGMSRSVRADDEIAGYHIPANTIVTLSPYVAHRDPRWWVNPEGFDPERFAPEQSANRPRYAYFPFSGGPRQCIGNEFALMEATLVLATVAQRYRLHLVPGHPVEPYPIFTLRPRYGVMMTLHATS
jgi:cytochrome P450